MIVDSVQLRMAQIEDSTAIADLLREAFEEFRFGYTDEAFREVTPPVEVIEKRFDEGPIWVAQSFGRIIGTVSTLPEPEWLYIRSMAVSPGIQGLGIGKRLLSEVEDFALNEGFEKLFLYTTHFSLPAIRLYEKLGFYVVRETTAEEWFGTPGLAMEKLIGRKLENVIGS